MYYIIQIKVEDQTVAARLAGKKKNVAIEQKHLRMKMPKFAPSGPIIE